MIKQTFLVGVIFASPLFVNAESNIHSINEFKDLRSHAPILYRLVPIESKAETRAKVRDEKQFPGKGHRLGGDPYENRLLGIDHDEGKRLYKLAMKKAKTHRQ